MCGWRRKAVRRSADAGTKRHDTEPDPKGHRLRQKKGFGVRLMLASMFVAVLSIAVPATSFADKDVDPARLAAAKELLVVVGSAKQFDVVVPLITQQLESAFVNLKPDHAAEIKDVFRAIPEKFSQKKQELLDQIAVIYAEKLTADEINEIIKFYKTPVGSRFVQLQPELVQQSMQLGQAWGRKIGQEIDQEVRKQLKDRGVPI
jgi:hypothetical protein